MVSRVAVVSPDAASRTAIGKNVLDPAARAPSAEAGPPAGGVGRGPGRRGLERLTESLERGNRHRATPPRGDAWARSCTRRPCPSTGTSRARTATCPGSRRTWAPTPRSMPCSAASARCSSALAPSAATTRTGARTRRVPSAAPGPARRSSSRTTRLPTRWTGSSSTPDLADRSGGGQGGRGRRLRQHPGRRHRPAVPRAGRARRGPGDHRAGAARRRDAAVPPPRWQVGAVGADQRRDRAARDERLDARRPLTGSLEREGVAGAPSDGRGRRPGSRRSAPGAARS